MSITEPATFYSDLVLALSAFAFAGILFKKNLRDPARTTRWWGRAFWALGLSALLGGFYHGSGNWWSAPLREVLWRATLFSMVLMSACLLVAYLFSAVGGRTRRIMLRFASLKAGAMTLWLGFDTRFLVAICDYGASMLIMVGLILLQPQRRASPAGRWFLAAVFTSVAGVIVQQGKIAPHPQFNHNDLFHVIQWVGNYFLYRGAQCSTDHRA